MTTQTPKDRYKRDMKRLLGTVPHYQCNDCGEGYTESQAACRECGSDVRQKRDDGAAHGDFGDKIRRHMCENEVYQILMRAGWNVQEFHHYAFTSSLPDWVPRETSDPISVTTETEMRQVLDDEWLSLSEIAGQVSTNQ